MQRLERFSRRPVGSGLMVGLVVMLARSAVADALLDQVSAAHAGHRAAVRNVVAQERVRFARPFGAGEETEARARMHRDLAAHEQQWIAAIAAEGNADPDWVTRQRQRQQAQLEMRIALLRLNADVDVTRLRTVDFVGERARLEDTDTRNVERMAAENGLTGATDAADLSRTRTRITTGDRSVVLYPRPMTIGFVPAGEKFDAGAELRKLGILPPALFEAGYERTAERDPVSGDVIFTATSERTRIVARLVESAGWRFSTYETYTADGGRLERFAVSDYRAAGSSMAPFQWTRTLAGEGAGGDAVETGAIESIQLNVADAQLEGRFDVPSDYRIQSFGD